MSKVDWSNAPEGAEFYAMGKFRRVDNWGIGWFYCDETWHAENAVKNYKALFKSEPDYQKRPEQITEIRVGDYIHKDELDTKEKYNDVVRVFEKFGCKWGENACKDFKEMKHSEILIWSSGLYQAADCHKLKKRQLTYEQIMALDKKEHVDVDNCNIDKVATMQPCKFKAVGNKVFDDQVKSPSHYQLMEGIESIEIIARSMTQAEWKGFCLGNMLKYRIRAGKKGNLQQDIDKADFYGELYEMHRGKCYDA